MKRWLGVIVSSVLAGCGGGNAPLPELGQSTVGDTTGLVERGQYIVRNVAVCGHCHGADPKDSDGPLSGGLAFKNWRLGTIRAANITPDSATGIGTWSEAQIVRAIRNGQDAEDHLLAPVMPYEWFHEMSDRDALAVARYLKSQPPVRHEVDSDRNLIFKLAKVFVLGPETDAIPPAPRRAPTPEYGAYLAQHVALCADCHTPRGGLQAKHDKDRLFAGNSDPPEGFPANPANLTPDTLTGIGRWSEADFLRTIETGVDPEGDSLHAFMPWREFRRMTDDDLRAIFAFLRTLKPIRNEVEHRHQAVAHHH